MQKVIQITDVSVDELIEKISAKLSTTVAKPRIDGTVMITILNRKQAARILDISVSLFDKLSGIGLIPATVNAGVNNRGIEIRRWAQHHLIAIKPIIARLKYNQVESRFSESMTEIKRTLGL